MARVPPLGYDKAAFLDLVAPHVQLQRSQRSLPIDDPRMWDYRLNKHTVPDMYVRSQIGSMVAHFVAERMGPSSAVQSFYAPGMILSSSFAAAAQMEWKRLFGGSYTTPHGKTVLVKSTAALGNTFEDELRFIRGQRAEPVAVVAVVDTGAIRGGKDHRTFAEVVEDKGLRYFAMLSGADILRWREERQQVLAELERLVG